MTARLFLIIVSATALLLAGAGLSLADSCNDLLLNRCEQCHYLSRVCQRLGKDGKWKWKRTIANMVRHGAKLDEAEQDLLVSCLAGNEAGAQAACQSPTAGKPYIQPLEKMPAGGKEGAR